MMRQRKYLKLIAGIVLFTFLLPQTAFAHSYPASDSKNTGIVGDIFIDGLKVDSSTSICCGQAFL